MLNFFHLIIFILGLIVGSFLNCLVYRLPKGESFLKGRSRCPKCKHELVWQDLIPVFSFLILRGRCRYCHQKISLQYPIIEMATGLIFLLIFIQFPVSNLQDFINLGFILSISSFLIVIFAYDFKHYLIPDKVVYPAILITFIYQFFKSLRFGTLTPLLSAFLASAFFLMIFLVSQGRWMGLGDVKLAFLIGLFLSWPKILVALFLAFFIGAIIGVGLIIAHKKTLKSEVPFGPFLVGGTFIALFWGNIIIDYYLGSFI